MRKILLGLAALALLGLGGAANAAPWVSVKTLEYKLDEQSATATRTVAAPVDPRYRWHNGQWWYSMPNNSWVVWSGGRWTPWTGGATAYRSNRYSDGGYYRGDRYYGDRYYRNGYRDGYRYGYRSPYYGGRAPYVSGYRGGVNVYGPGVGVRNGGRRW